MRRSILAKIIDLFFPRFCPICGNRLVGEEESICLSCNLHLPRTDTWEKPYDNEMAKMFWHQIPIEKACALFYYKGHSFVSNVLYQLKYNNRPEIASDMGKLLAQEGMRVHFFDGIDGIIPIPLARSRQKERGYNQSEEIAKGIAVLTHLPIYTDISCKMKLTIKAELNMFIKGMVKKPLEEGIEKIADALAMIPYED
jgi:predicted amidophosphoribosyltransferase